MSSLRRLAVMAVPTAFALAALFAAPACSSDTSTTDTADATADAPRDVNKGSDDAGTGGGGDSGGGTADAGLQACLDKCDTNHPSAVAKDKAITDCWDTKCDAQCNNDPSSPFDGGTADPDAGGDGGAPTCNNPPDTNDANCDACTNSQCCGAWDACFDDSDCADYEDCLSTCFTNFPEDG